MEDNKVSVDEARRAAQHELIKSKVVQDVNAGIAERAERTTHDEAQVMEKVAGEFRGKAIAEVVGTDREVRRARTLARISQVVDYVFYVVYTLLVIRIVLAVIAARSANGFVKFIQFTTEPFYALFRGIVGSPTAGGITLILSIIIAIIIFVVLHAGIIRLLRLIAHRKTEI